MPHFSKAIGYVDGMGVPMPDAFSLQSGYYYDAHCRKCGEELTACQAICERPCRNCGFPCHRSFPRFISFD